MRNINLLLWELSVTGRWGQYLVCRRYGEGWRWSHTSLSADKSDRPLPAADWRTSPPLCTSPSGSPPPRRRSARWRSPRDRSSPSLLARTGRGSRTRRGRILWCGSWGPPGGWRPSGWGLQKQLNRNDMRNVFDRSRYPPTSARASSKTLFFPPLLLAWLWLAVVWGW